MRATVDRKALSDAMSACLRAVDRRATIAICSHFLVRCADGRITLTATDLDIEVTASAPAEVETEGVGTLLADTASGFVQRVKTPSVTLAWGEGRCRLTSGRSRCEVSARDPQDFSSLVATAEATTFTVSGADLRRCIETCAWASLDDTSAGNFALCGVFVRPTQSQDHKLRFSAGNGYCVALAACDAPAEADAITGFILPNRAAAEIARLAEGDVAVSASRSYVRCAFPSGVTLTTKVIDGVFPDFWRNATHATASAVVTGADEVVGALDRIALAVDPKLSHAVRVEIGTDDVTLSRRDGTRGLVIETLAAASTMPEAQTFGLNAIWFGKAARAIGNREMSLSLLQAHGQSGAVIRPADADLPLFGIGLMGVPA